MTIAAQPDEQVFDIPTATDAQVIAIQAVRMSMATVLEAMAKGAGCNNGLTTFFTAAEQFQSLWNQKIAVFGQLLAPGLPSSLQYIATDGIDKDGKWGPQMATCCAALDQWPVLGIALPPVKACNVALWLAAYPDAPSVLQVRVVNSMGSPAQDAPADVPVSPPPAAPEPTPAPAPTSADVTFSAEEEAPVLGTRSRTTWMPWWGWGLVGVGALTGGYFLWWRKR